MSLFRLLSVSDTSEAIAEESGSVHPAFLVICGIVAIGFVIMIIQNFIIKKEEYYKLFSLLLYSTKSSITFCEFY